MEEKKLNHVATVYLVQKVTRDLTIASEIKLVDVETVTAVRIINNSVRHKGQYKVKRVDFSSEIKEAETVYKYIRRGAFNQTCEVNRLKAIRRLQENHTADFDAAFKEAKSRERKFKEAVEIVKAAIEDYYERMNSKNFK